jgi:hypothetical protein
MGGETDRFAACSWFVGPRPNFTARYIAAMADCGGRCPIEAGLFGWLADLECRHGRLPFDRTPACGCWPDESAAVLALPPVHGGSTSGRRAA